MLAGLIGNVWQNGLWRFRWWPMLLLVRDRVCFRLSGLALGVCEAGRGCFPLLCFGGLVSSRVLIVGLCLVVWLWFAVDLGLLRWLCELWRSRCGWVGVFLCSCSVDGCWWWWAVCSYWAARCGLSVGGVVAALGGLGVPLVSILRLGCWFLRSGRSGQLPGDRSFGSSSFWWAWSWLLVWGPVASPVVPPVDRCSWSLAALLGFSFSLVVARCVLKVFAGAWWFVSVWLSVPGLFPRLRWGMNQHFLQYGFLRGGGIFWSVFLGPPTSKTLQYRSPAKIWFGVLNDLSWCKGFRCQDISGVVETSGLIPPPQA